MRAVASGAEHLCFACAAQHLCFALCSLGVKHKKDLVKQNNVLDADQIFPSFGVKKFFSLSSGVTLPCWS